MRLPDPRIDDYDIPDRIGEFVAFLIRLTVLIVLYVPVMIVRPIRRHYLFERGLRNIANGSAKTVSHSLLLRVIDVTQRGCSYSNWPLIVLRPCSRRSVYRFIKTMRQQGRVEKPRYFKFKPSNPL